VTTPRLLRVALGALGGAAVSLSVAAQDMTVMVPADDGTLLATDIYLPDIGSSWPVWLTRTPYGKDDHRDQGELVAVLGAAYVVQDTRGRFASGGTDTVFRDDGPDGRATLAWVAEQPWCNGRIATWGGSATGITQYLMAPGAGPELVSQMSVVATPDLYAHAFVQGGAIREALVWNWLADQGSLFFYDEVRRHRLRDAWWDVTDVLAAAPQVNVPGLHLGGWYDIFCQGTLDAFVAFQEQGGEAARNRQYLVMGPWTHDVGEVRAGEILYPAAAELDPDGLYEAWLARWLFDTDLQIDSMPAVQVFLMGAAGEAGAPGNQWLGLDHWPPASETAVLYLTPAGGLATPPPAAGSVELTIDPADPVPTLGGANLFPDLLVGGRRMGAGPHDQQAIETRADVLSFSTEVLSQPVTVAGRVSCTIWVEPDTPDLDRRARSRCGDATECLLTPGVPTALSVDLWSTAIVFNAGHRIRIDVSGTNSPRFEVNPNHGGDLNDTSLGTVVARPQLRFGPDYPSRLELPVASGLGS
jgi:hypothetical protein